MSQWNGKRTAIRVLAAGVVLSAVLAAGGRLAASAGPSGVRGTQGYLGVDIRDVSDDQVSVLKLKEARGAEVVRVDHDGPAGKVGLREHDVILQMNGEMVQGQEQLRRMLHETPAGRAVALVISRDGQQQTLNTQLANREEVERNAWQQHLTVPEPLGFSDAQGTDASAGAASGPGGRVGGVPDASGATAPATLGFFHSGTGGGHTHGLISSVLGSPYTGAVVEPMGAQLAEFFGVKDGAGLLVRSVEANSPAATAGLRAGDVVMRANQSALASSGDWARMMHENRGKAVALTVVREKKEQTLSLTPDAKRRSAMDGSAWPMGPGFAELAGPNGGDLVASVSGVNEAELGKMMDEARTQRAMGAKALADARKQSMLNEAELGKMLDDARTQSVLSKDHMAKMLEDAGRQRALAAEVLSRNLPDARVLRQQMDEMMREMQGLPGRMD